MSRAWHGNRPLSMPEPLASSSNRATAAPSSPRPPLKTYAPGRNQLRGASARHLSSLTFSVQGLGASSKAEEAAATVSA
eukprot:scaffold27982_cov31-Tisochrysis_lutea.AAC.11